MKDHNLNELHWLMDILKTTDVGLVVIDRQYQICMWNSFMANHSGVVPSQAMGKSLFTLFPDLPSDWLKDQIDAVFVLKNRMYSAWEQRERLFDFNAYRSITGKSDKMFQNVQFFPLASSTGSIEQVCIAIYDVTEVAVGKRDLQTANRELARVSRTDRLTKLYNRGYWEERLESEFKRARRTGAANSSLVLFDIDHFKQVNDTHGHRAGDEVIRSLADLLRKTQRETDIAGRYGGEEFGVILVDTDAVGGRFFCERLRRVVEKSVVKADGVEIRYTISLGVSEVGESVEGHAQWLESADQALYQSKHGGRNQTTVFETASD